MERIDEDGKWIIKDGVEMLTEPSAEWIFKNQTKTIDQQRQEILSELQRLDLIISRTQEQFMLDNNLFCTYQPILDAITQKHTLRIQLNGL
jgi:hypothetical protein